MSEYGDGVVLLVDEGDVEAVRVWLAGYLAGAVIRGELPFEAVKVEPHVVGERFVPSFEVELGRFRYVVHVDVGIGP